MFETDHIVIVGNAKNLRQNDISKINLISVEWQSEFFFPKDLRAMRFDNFSVNSK